MILIDLVSFQIPIVLYSQNMFQFVSICFSLQWRYKFNHTKSEVVTFGESKPLHLPALQSRKWVLGDDIVDELYEYKNLGVLKTTSVPFLSILMITLKRHKRRPV